MYYYFNFIYKFLQEGPAYVRVFVSILRDISKEDTIEYVLALIDEMLTGKILVTKG